jgi:hypothetical protein
LGTIQVSAAQMRVRKIHARQVGLAEVHPHKSRSAKIDACLFVLESPVVPGLNALFQ